VRAPALAFRARDGVENQNLADPAFEPTDDDLTALATRAFAHVPKAQEEALRKLRADIATARLAALERLRERKSSSGSR
jgi:hypothetical protein